MLTAAAGLPCVVTASTDFEMDRVTLNPLAFDIDLRFEGSGKQLRLASGAFALTAEIANIQSISGFARASRTIDGNTTTLTRVAVPDSSGYAKGSAVKIVSDDVDPDARDTSGRRGEFATVADVSTGYIWLNEVLEDYGLYLTSPRIGKLSKRKVSIKNHRVQSAYSNAAAQMYSINNLVDAYLELDVQDHGWTAIALNGCVQSKVDFSGSGKGDSDKSLGYGILDHGGARNRLRVRGSGWRHIITTGHNGATAGGDMRLFGATRDMLVLDSVAIGCTNAAYDDHEGARRSKFVRCASYGARNGTNAGRFAFQGRGRDVRIIDCYADASHDAMVSVTSAALGTLVVEGGRSDCPPLYSSNTTPMAVILDNHVSEDGASMLGGSNLTVSVIGGSYTLNTGGNNGKVLDVCKGSVWTLNGPEFILDGGGSSERFVYLRDPDGSPAGKVFGSLKTRNRKPSGTVQAIVRSDIAAGQVARLKVLHLEGTRPSPNSGSFSSGALSYAVHDAVGGSHVTNITTVDDLAKLLAAV